jgi:type IV pilus assembly protein PilA
MLARIRKAQEEKESGFTLIELLVVMIIIGILAAIAIPVFLSQRAKAQDSATKADASTVGKEVATWYVDNTTAPVVVQTAGGRYGLADTAANAALAANDVGKASANVTYVAASSTFATPTTWCVQFNNTQGSAGKQTWSYSAANGLRSVAC